MRSLADGVLSEIAIDSVKKIVVPLNPGLQEDWINHITEVLVYEGHPMPQVKRVLSELSLSTKRPKLH